MANQTTEALLDYWRQEGNENLIPGIDPWDTQAAVKALEDPNNRATIVDAQSAAYQESGQAPVTPEAAGGGESAAATAGSVYSAEFVKWAQAQGYMDENGQLISAATASTEMSNADSRKAQAYYEIWKEDIPESYLSSNSDKNLVEFVEQEKQKPAYLKTEHYEKAFTDRGGWLASVMGADLVIGGTSTGGNEYDA